ncbi:CHAT domain-containing protein [Aequorivita marisscotiae]|uniref:CHAT domain-containing protein n=1 Tax=Aequorivita marisscotiae TaxID=3040348 RepID=A0ABY8KUP2_9FLAO|nr:CHAT domain-containing protein [Aequorivita sp. Ant34-E75]WGF93153.1 CHAT domain-containing protein [Aequorivita sp. Ant34-E75]
MVFKYNNFLLLILTAFLVFSQKSFGQDTDLSGIKLIDGYLLNNQLKEADIALHTQIENFKQAKQIDSLAQYTVYVGKVAFLKSNPNNAAKKADAFFKNLITLGASKRAQHKALYGLSQLYEELGNITESFNAAEKSLNTIRSVPNATHNEIGEAYYALTYSYYISGKFLDANKQAKKALSELKKSEIKNYKKISDVNNFFGIMMWRSQKLDSAQYFFENAIKTLQKIQGDSVYKVYSSSGIKLNMALVMEARGNISESIQTLERLIQDCNFVINESKDVRVVSRSKRLKWTGISNLGSLYTNIGHVNRANKLMAYIYNNRDQLYLPGDPEIPRALILLAQSQMALKETGSAVVSLEKALAIYETDSSPDVYWQAIAIANLASCYDLKGEIEKAEKSYSDAEKLYKIALGENLDDTYLGFAQDKSLFLAKNGKDEAALTTSLNAYKYLKKNGGENNSDLIAHTLNLSEVYYTIGDFAKAAEWSQKGIDYIDARTQNKSTRLDVLKLTYRKPLLILAKSEALYAQNTSKDSIFLKSLLKNLGDAFKILEEQKALISKDDNVNVLYSNFLGLYNFTKQLYYDLYTQTDNKKYLTKLIETHENSVYYTIRSKLMLQDKINFADVPQAVIKRESELKNEAVNLSALSEDSSSSFQNYLDASTIYNLFLDSLKTAYPKYYQMKYATLDASLKDLQKYIPANTTIIRYLFIEKNLYGIVLDSKNRSILPLKYKSVKNHIEKLSDPKVTFEVESNLLYELYQQLWKPLSNRISNEKIVVIPDGPLFNLSFETLTPSKIKSYKELATTSLLASYSISYNFSLLLLNEDKKPKMFSENFVAFAPGFTKKMKSEYKIAITDSVNSDIAYLTLLSQPSSVELAENYSKIFDGQSFINENSTKQIFKANAGDHKIIHIGTHAESNNVSPEFSRLIFAKKYARDNSYDENSLYTYEIYNTNLNSNLAILTACETGKPTYQPGEGMISLAHAFNYAGSESILTSLWQIDEESSVKIIQNFYENLAEGMAKDEALRQAKLNYIATAKGRTVSPQYWAGMVLIGDTAPIQLQHNFNPIWWWVLGFLLIGVFIIFLLKRKKINKA